ncbi:RuBisCO large subunit C-terminal-like domain-containing protein [Candidatus Pelagibacter sp. Uisw_094]|jgi:ribulose-bisphosphate carboxylase large chain|uniref:RuBisCO large subunit C-terminal-like domain-containing protein n=1 Tax=Candidatus Pelagibacter sp. Uisw_094 TaxID=3230980 RepID=UPI0039EB0F19|tara:strand:- start:87 stop:1280 length:1194 start_codon:yes stop_codon:yes gene_type:complete
MLFFNENIDKEKYIIAEYYIKSTSNSDLAKCSWNLAIGQSVGNPNIRNQWETEELFENHSCVILSQRENLINQKEGCVKIGFPVINTDWEGDGVSHLLCQLMGGQMDIDTFLSCRLKNIEFPDSVRKFFLGPKFGISGIRKFLNLKEKPLSGAIVKPKTGMSPKILLEMVKELVDGGVDFIKEDEILSNPNFCKIEERVELISNFIAKQKKPVIYAVCINGDHEHILKRVDLVNSLGGNAVHVNFWSGLGVYNSIRKKNLPIFLHFQKSGDKVITDKRHHFGIDWYVICKLAGMMGVDTIHAGMWGGYLSDDENDLRKAIDVLHDQNVMPALSCGMHPGLVQANIRQFGSNFIANVGGAIHGHPGGTLSGAMAMRQAIDKNHGPEYNQAITKWGLTK